MGACISTREMLFPSREPLLSPPDSSSCVHPPSLRATKASPYKRISPKLSQTVLICHSPAIFKFSFIIAQRLKSGLVEGRRTSYILPLHQAPRKHKHGRGRSKSQPAYFVLSFCTLSNCSIFARTLRLILVIHVNCEYIVSLKLKEG